MGRPVRLAVAQLPGAPSDPAAARATSAAAADELLVAGADLVILPELCVPGYVLDAERLLGSAEPLDGPTVSGWQALAREHGGMICGGFAERVGDHVFNTAVMVDADGVILHYRKLHLFAEEKLVLAPGDLGLPVAATRLGRIGICVCYDLRFVETVRALALQGADLVCVPTAWTAGFDDVRWDADGMAPQARGAILQANLNQVFIACASAVGEHGTTVFLGSSIVADPRGTLLAGPLAQRDPASAVVEVDLDDAGAAQHRGPLISPREDRRTDVYGLRIGSDVW